MRKQPKQARSRELVDAILGGATRVFAREGLSATTNRVAFEAGVSVGSLYQYFPNKDALLVALAERHIELVTQRVEEVLSRASDGALLPGLIEQVVRAVLSDHQQHPHLRQLMRVHGPQLPELAARFDACIAKVRRALVDHLARLRPGLSDGELRVQLMVSAVDGLLHGDNDLRFDARCTDEIVALCVGYLTR